MGNPLGRLYVRRGRLRPGPAGEGPEGAPVVIHRHGAAVVVISCALALVLLPACGDDGEPPVVSGRLDDDSVTVGSFDFPESVLLAELYSQALEQSGLVVRESLPTDARVSIISITAFGRQALESVHAVRLEIIARALAGADDSQVAAATTVLDAVAGCLAVPDERPAEIRPA